MKYWVHRLKNIAFENIIDIYANRQKDLFFIQVGAHDGRSGDPIHNYVVKYGWRGILVEPVKYLFDRLVANYRGQAGLLFENAAISDKNESRDIYRLRETSDNLPSWYDQIASLDPEFALRQEITIPNVKDYLIAEKVKCVTFETLLKKYSVEHLGLLQVDAEGYDYEIIKAIDFRTIKPRVVRYENKHLSAVDRAACESLLKQSGYLIMDIAEDTVAYLKFPGLRTCLFGRVVCYLIRRALNRIVPHDASETTIPRIKIK
jgi:FkbM family methyltransferase